MNKNLYYFGVFFLGLIVTCGLFQNIAQFLFGVQLYMQDSFVAWLMVSNIVSVTGAIFLLKYYHYRGYWSAF